MKDSKLFKQVVQKSNLIVRRRSTQIVGSVILASGALLAFTNPSLEAYTDYATQQIPKHLQKKCGDFNDNAMSIKGYGLRLDTEIPAQDLCKTTMGLASWLFKLPMRYSISENTQRKNFILGSIYTTQLPGIKIKTVAIAGNYFFL